MERMRCLIGWKGRDQRIRARREVWVWEILPEYKCKCMVVACHADVIPEVSEVAKHENGIPFLEFAFASVLFFSHTFSSNSLRVIRDRDRDRDRETPNKARLHSSQNSPHFSLFFCSVVSQTEQLFASFPKGS